MTSYSVIAFGCKVNQVEAQAIREQLERIGFSPVAKGQTPNVVVLHTCAVTTEAMRKIRQRLRSIRRRLPEAILAVSGCYVIAEPETLANAGEIDIAEKHWPRLVNALLAATVRDPTGKKIEKEPISARWTKRLNETTKTHPENIAITTQSAARTPPPDPIRSDTPARVKNQSSTGLTLTSRIETISRLAGHHRAFVKIQDGCDSFCAYCIVPHLRNKLRSKPVEQAVEEVAALLAGGYREIILVGIHLGAWGQSTTKNTSPSRLPALLAPLLELNAPDDAPWRIRLSSIEAREVTDELLELMTHPRVCQHLHLPLQSGSNDVLGRMGRPTTTAEAFRETVARARRVLDRPAISADVIVGFPGETDADFQATLDLCREIGFAKTHVFPYSLRNGTRAAEMPDHIPTVVRRQRARILRELSEERAADFVSQFVGQSERVIPERTDPKRQTASGHADRYFQIAISPTAPLGDLLNVEITTTENARALARLT